jgi:very-short-patch-repair endonuclease
MDIAPIIALAEQQANVVSVRQCLAQGTPATTLYRAAQRHHLGRPHTGVLTLPGADLDDFRTRVWVALCAVGSPAWIGGLASLALRELVRAPELVDVVVPPDRKPTPPAGCRLRRLRTDHRDVARLGSVPLLQVARGMAEVAASETYDDTLGAAAAALQRQATTLQELRTTAARVRTGARGLRLVADDLAGSRAQSVLAHRVTDLLRGHGFQLDAEVPVVRPDGSTALLDLAVRGTPVGIEVDGHAVHSGREKLSADRTRQNQLVLTGRTVLRVDWLRLQTDPDGFVAEVRAAVVATSRAAP